jgi:tRNA-modifying protein YgfZ
MNTHTSLSGTVALMHWGVIRAQGDDAVSFLQGQLTQDVAKLGSGGAALAGYCSPKGRLLASFVICKPAADEVLLLCHRSVLAATLKRLQMFVMRAKCKLTDATAELPLFGAAGDSAVALMGDLPVWGRSENCLRWPDSEGLTRVVLMAPTVPPLPSLSLDDWQWLEVRSAIATIEAATVDQFVPQMLNYEQLGGVNFQKGCYPGQEIVARSQFRGTIKRRAYLFETDGPIAVGQEVFHSSDAAQPSGLVVNVAHNPSGVGFSALVEVKMASLESGSLRVAVAEGAAKGAVLKLQALPYAMTLEI